MGILRFDDAVKYLESIPQFTGEEPGLKYGVQRAKILLERIGNPDKDLKVIHVAGTNGKGSVCAYISACLESQGISTGLFTSPHLADIRERIRVSGEMISKEDFTRLFNPVLEETEKVKEETRGFEAAYFEYLLMIALIYFKEKNTDCVILETGLGGRLDATNAVEGTVLSVITGIALEHTDILGNSPEEIAKEKAGIIKPGIPVVVAGDDIDILKIFQKVAEENGSRLIYADYGDVKGVSVSPENVDFSLENEYYRNVSFTVPVPAVYEAVNAATALTAMAVIKESGLLKGFSGSLTKADREAFDKALRNTVWEGRMERIFPDTYVDGAHNPQGVELFIKSVEAFASGKKNILLFSVVSDKAYEDMVKAVAGSGLFSEYVITRPDTKRALSQDDLLRLFGKYTDRPVKAFSDVKEAFEYAKAKEKDYLFCVGSLYLIGEIKKLKG